MGKNIIDNKQIPKRVFFEGLLTTAGWLFVLYSAIQIIATVIIWLFNIRNTYYTFDKNIEVIYTLFGLIILSVVIYIGIAVWSNYNLKKYGKLNRRKFAKDVTDDEIVAYFNISGEQ